MLWIATVSQSRLEAQSGSLFQGAPNAPSNASSPYPGTAPAPQPQVPYPMVNAPQGGTPNTPPYAGIPYASSPPYAPGPWNPMNGVVFENPYLQPNLQASYTYQPPVPARTLRVNDIVSIRVEEISQMLAQGNTTSRKTMNFDAVLQQWVRLVGLDTIKPSPQPDGDPGARFVENEVYRGDSTMRTAEQMTFNIAARIADIQPNGNVVLEARKSISQSDNRFEASLSGICRAEDIGPNNVILSRHIYDLKIDRQDSGHVRDGYSRGWLTKWYARLKPF